MRHFGLERGYWGCATSSLDWCEENYAVSWFIAEFWNTLSNLFFILAPLWKVHKILLQQQKVSNQKTHLLEWRHILSFFLTSLTGIGSLAFHATLWYEMQLLDELPMIFGASQYLYCLARRPKGSYNLFLAVVLAGQALLISYVYVWWRQNAIFHQVAFGCLVAAIIAVYIVRCLIFRQKSSKPVDGFSPEAILAMVAAFAGAGFGFWNVDNQFCSQLRAMRTSMTPVLTPLLQFHSLWHLLTCIAIMWLNSGILLLDYPEDLTVGLGAFMLPEIRLRRPRKLD